MGNHQCSGRSQSLQMLRRMCLSFWGKKVSIWEINLIYKDFLLLSLEESMNFIILTYYSYGIYDLVLVKSQTLCGNKRHLFLLFSHNSNDIDLIGENSMIYNLDCESLLFFQLLSEYWEKSNIYSRAEWQQKALTSSLTVSGWTMLLNNGLFTDG